MLIAESQRRQTELKNYIMDMASEVRDDKGIRQMAIKMKTLYSDGFRHSYSEFFPAIVEISKDDNNYSLDYLTNNLESVRSFVEKEFVADENKFKELYYSLQKLSDHINLEVARYTYYYASEQKIRDIEKKIISLQNDLRDARAELKREEEQAASMQTQYTTILGIFAAVILAFVGSFTFSTSVLDHISDANIYRVIIVSLIVGMVFYNMVCALIHFLREINGMKKKEDYKASFLTKDNWAFNIVIGILIIVTLLIGLTVS